MKPAELSLRDLAMPHLDPTLHFPAVGGGASLWPLSRYSPRVTWPAEPAPGAPAAPPHTAPAPAPQGGHPSGLAPDSPASAAELASYETNFALQLKGWRENMENFCGSKPPEGGCGSRQAQGFYPLWQPTASVFHGNRRFADCDPIAQFDRFDPRTTIGLPLEVRAVSRALDFLIPVSEALPQRAAAKGNVKREKHFPKWESNFGPLGSVLRALPTEPRHHDDCTVRRVRVVFALSSWLEAAGYGKYDSNPSHCAVIVASWLSW
ncbi:Translation initiation factor IF-2 [Frankliniella fusca]|uniref:Translation initiation factor IF-2 n=1 Tax=Frankliniella fusca TaxID=407009 RepID=A0AAE1H5J8_9NEOP|nr:Translation initiation factor IF-2 [Frankliniella fusca]